MSSSNSLPSPVRARSGVWTSLLLSSLTVVIYLGPPLGEWLAYDRAAIAAGQLWRLVTGHWTHWTADHLGWDLVVFAVLGVFWERTGRRRAFLVCVFGSALLISLAVWLVLPEMSLYRGLSGVDCALVTAIAAHSLRRSLSTGRHGLSLALAAALAGYFLKVLYELTTGATVFVHAENAAFTAVPLAHVVGGIFGLAVGLREK